MAETTIYRVPPCVAWLANIQDGGVPGFREVRRSQRAVWIEGDDIASVVRTVLDLGEPYAYDPEVRGAVRRAVLWARAKEVE